MFQRAASTRAWPLSCVAICCSVRSSAAVLIPARRAVQPVIALLAWRAVPQCRLDDTLGHEAPCGAAQPLHRPGEPGAAVQDAHDITPKLGRAHPPYGRRPRVNWPCRSTGGGVAASADLADSVRTTRVQTRIPTDAAVAARGHDLGARADQRWATAPSTCSEIMPCGVVVSIGSRKRIKSLCGARPPQKLRWTNAGRWTAIGAMGISPGTLGAWADNRGSACPVWIVRSLYRGREWRFQYDRQRHLEQGWAVGWVGDR